MHKRSSPYERPEQKRGNRSNDRRDGGHKEPATHLLPFSIQPLLGGRSNSGYSIGLLPTEQFQLGTIKVGGQSEVKKVAGAISHSMRGDASPSMIAAGMNTRVYVERGKVSPFLPLPLSSSSDLPRFFFKLNNFPLNPLASEKDTEIYP